VKELEEPSTGRLSESSAQDAGHLFTLSNMAVKKDSLASSIPPKWMLESFPMHGTCCASHPLPFHPSPPVTLALLRGFSSHSSSNNAPPYEQTALNQPIDIRSPMCHVSSPLFFSNLPLRFVRAFYYVALYPQPQFLPPLNYHCTPLEGLTTPNSLDRGRIGKLSCHCTNSPSLVNWSPCLGSCFCTPILICLSSTLFLDRLVLTQH
jgi:hypothetical protein